MTLPRVVATLSAGAGFALVVAPVAAAPVLRVDHGCYYQAQEVTAKGAGFKPGAAYRTALDGAEIGTGTVASDGKIAGKFDAPDLDVASGERTFRLTISDGDNIAAARFRVSSFDADFAPKEGPISDLEVDFTVYGFGPKRSLYLHYIAPNGKRRATRRLGGTRGICGRFVTDNPRKLFQFEPRAGTWKLQFDTRRKWSKRTTPRIVHRYRVFET